MAAIALTIIILLNYLAFYYAYGAFEGSVGTKKKRFFSHQKSRRCAPGGGAANILGFFAEKKHQVFSPAAADETWHALKLFLKLGKNDASDVGQRD
jgi:hypothetical protein